jgi:hypothetical protein
MKSLTQEELVLKELEMVKEVVRTKKKEGLKHSQKIIIKLHAKINFKNKEIKVFKNGQLNLYKQLKGMEEVLH